MVVVDVLPAIDVVIMVVVPIAVGDVDDAV